MSPGEWQPGFEGQRPPFEPGNEVAVSHGAYSPRKVAPLAQELVAAVLADSSLPYVSAHAYRPAVWAWARAEAQTQLLTEYLEAKGAETADGVGDLDDERVRSAYLLLHRAEARATTGRTRLGLDPLSRARLGKDVAQGAAANADVALRMAQLHEAEQRLLEQGWTPPAIGGGDGA